jgi:dCMP deaminase
VIIQAGIGEIIYLSDKYKETDQVKASKRMLDMSPHISYRQLVPKLDSLLISFAPPEG